MSGRGDKPRSDMLHMAKGKSPWGGRKRGEDSPGESPGETVAEDGEVKEAEAIDTGTGDEAPKRNPWLPPGEEGDARRSARIEDILRQRRGPSGSDGGGWPPLPGGDRARVILPWVLAGSAVLLAFSTSFHVVEQGQSGTVTTLGRYSRSLGPGSHLSLPWPIETVAIRGGKGSEVLSMPDKGGEMLLLTSDGELIDLSFLLRWQVSDGRRFAMAFADPEASLRSLAVAETRAGVAEVSFDELYEGRRQAELQQRVAGRIQRALDAQRAGIRIDSLEVTRAKPPARLAEAFKKVDAAKAEIDRERKKAQDWALQTRNNARAEATAFNKVYEQYQLAPQVIRKRMYYETMERVLRNNQNIVISPTGPGPLPPRAAGPMPSPSGGQ